MLQPDNHVDNALHITINTMQDIITHERNSGDYTRKTLAALRLLLQQIASSSQVTPAQNIQFQHLLTLLETIPSTNARRNRRNTSTQAQTVSKPEAERDTTYIRFNVRDINMICEEYGDVYALIEGEKRPRKINRARRRQGVLEIRTVAHDEWKGPVAWVEWINGLGEPARYTEREIR